MLIPVVIVIGAMWLPVALLFLGKGEAKGTGFITGVVGALVLIGSMINSSSARFIVAIASARVLW